MKIKCGYSIGSCGIPYCMFVYRVGTWIVSYPNCIMYHISIYHASYRTKKCLVRSTKVSCTCICSCKSAPVLQVSAPSRLPQRYGALPSPGASMHSPSPTQSLRSSIIRTDLCRSVTVVPPRPEPSTDDADE